MSNLSLSRVTEVVKIKMHNENAKVPTYAHPTDCGADVYAVPNSKHDNGLWDILPGETIVVDLGFSIELRAGWEMQVRSRSGLAKKGLVVANSPGTIDSDYRGECKVLLHNNTNDKTFHIEPGDRVAQFCLSRTPQAYYDIVDELVTSDRGEGGFGSTGS